jgi:dienelactone hydrolase
MMVGCWNTTSLKITSFFLVLVTGLSVMLASLAAGAQTADAPDRIETIAGLQVALWLPPAATSASPLILFSHGFDGCKTQSSHLMRALSNRGILVAAPDHKDKLCAEKLDLSKIVADLPRLSDSVLSDRRDDLLALRKGLLEHPTLASSIDPSRTALVGHSLGGYTVLALAGARPGWKMDGITGVIALAPYTEPFRVNGTPESIFVPVLFEVGDKDQIAGDSNDFYSKAPSPACQVTYTNADHFAWVDPEALPPELGNSGLQQHTIAAAVAFLDDIFAERHPSIILPSSSPAKAECK